MAATTQRIRVTARQLREGDLVRISSGVGIAHIEYDGGIAPSRVLVRPAGQLTRWFGLVTRWKTWDELDTPVQEVPMDREMEVVAA